MPSVEVAAAVEFAIDPETATKVPPPYATEDHLALVGKVCAVIFSSAEKMIGAFPDRLCEAKVTTLVVASTETDWLVLCGIPVPVTVIPTVNEAVFAIVTMAEPVVVPAVRVIAASVPQFPLIVMVCAPEAVPRLAKTRSSSFFESFRRV